MSAASLSTVDDFVSACRQLCAEQRYPMVAMKAKSDLPHMSASVGRVDAAFEACTSPKFTTIMVVLLAAKAKHNALSDWKLFVSQVQAMVTVSDRTHILFVRDLFDLVVHEMTNLLRENGAPAAGIPVVDAAIRRVQPDLRLLTPIHADLCLLCLQCKNFKPVMEFLETDVQDLAVDENGKFDSLYFVLYFYYGGLIYCALKSFRRASLFFEAAITCPATVTSAVVIEAYKKFTLVSLMLDGDMPSLPSYTSACVSMSLQLSASIYIELGDLVKSFQVREFLLFVQRNELSFRKDENFGLVKQVQDSLYRRNILRLTKAFVTVSLTDVARRAALPDAQTAEKYLLDMMVRGEIFATLDQQSGVVRFHSNPELTNSSEVAEELGKRVRDSTETLALLTKLARQADVNPGYLRRKLDIAQNGSAPAGGYSDGLAEKDDVDFNMSL
ncbi:COP9 signalosome complex subunit 3-like [Sycon ciliatum]|uniref:COP9 signalosome complex subunit 3-like n=1 Tax=Sycon ciliatum TaxID=27933 RepID=UPI0020A96E6E|eukprot:scpid57755/ scgid27368/ COP9 signalosome complex subunit 3